MAPEVLVQKQYSKKGDVYNYGVVLKQYFEIEFKARRGDILLHTNLVPCQDIEKDQVTVLICTALTCHIKWFS